MNNDVLTIVKKEFTRFFGDKRLLITSVFLPGILIFVMYSFMGKGMMQSFSVSDDYIPNVYVVNIPEELRAGLDSTGIELIDVSANEITSVKERIIDNQEDDKVDALVVFPEDFINKIESYDVLSGEKAENIGIYFNSANTKSSYTYSMLEQIFNAYENQMANKFDINAFSDDEKYDLATEKETTGMLFSMIMPLLLLIFLYTGCMSIAPDSIAGEKERGTIATLLVTPIKRSSLALGKILSLSVFSLLSGVSSFLGTMLSMPALMGGSSEAVDASVYSVKDYVLLFVLIITTVLFFVSVLAVISAYAKSVKEAGTLVLPFMLIIMGVSLSSMMGGAKVMSLTDAFVPIYGIVKCISGIFAFNYNVLYVLITAGVNLVLTGLLTFVLTKMFNNEKIMFSN